MTAIRDGNLLFRSQFSPHLHRTTTKPTTPLMSIEALLTIAKITVTIYFMAIAWSIASSLRKIAAQKAYGVSGK